MSLNISDGTWDATFAIDGNDNTFYHTPGTDPQDAWLQIDFGEELAITGVLLVHRIRDVGAWNSYHHRYTDIQVHKLFVRAQRLINLEIPVLVRSLKSSNVELG